LFDVTPSVGVPYKTEFTFAVQKGQNLKCEFGYKNDIGNVALPTEDT
jgi:hypothetical protein